MTKGTRVARVVMAAAVTAACGLSPTERAYELVDTFEVTTRGNIEVYQQHRSDFETRYGDSQARCEPGFEVPDVPNATWARYNMQMHDRLSLTTTALRAQSECDMINITVERLGAAVVRRASMTPEDVAITANRLRGTVATFDGTQLGIVLENARTDEAAWAVLMAAINEDQFAERLTREQSDARLERIWKSLDEALSTLEESEGTHAAVRDELTARVIAMGNGTWPLP